MKPRAIIPIALELLGIAIIGVGVGIEFAYEADIGFIAITGGSCLVACGGVLWGKFMRKARHD